MASNDILDAYMVITGSLASGGTIKGETQDAEYGPVGGFKLLDFSWGVTHSESADEDEDEDEDEDDDDDDDDDDAPLARTKGAPQGSRGVKGRVNAPSRSSTVKGSAKKKKSKDKSKSKKKKKKKEKKDSSDAAFLVKKGDLRVNKIKISKLFDNASPSLFSAVCDDSTERTGGLMGTIYFRKAGEFDPPFVYFQIELASLMVISVSWDFDDEFPTEKVEFEFVAVNITYTPQLDDGTAGSPLIASWDRDEANADGSYDLGTLFTEQSND